MPFLVNWVYYGENDVVYAHSHGLSPITNIKNPAYQILSLCLRINLISH